MSEGINLSIGRTEVKKEVKKHLVFSIVFLSAVALFTLILVGTNYIFTSRHDALVAKEANLRDQIQTQSAKKAKLLLLHERLATASKIITARKNLNEKFATALALAPDGVSVRTSNITSSLISMGFESADLAALNEFLNALYGLDESEKDIKKVQVNSFGVREDVYVLDVNFTF
jgi:hypothetical protein